MSRPTLRPPKMYSGLQTRRTAHQLYLKMSYLELEKVRRRKELEAVSNRMHLLEERSLELEEEIAATQAEIEAHPETVTKDAVQRIQEARGAGLDTGPDGLDPSRPHSASRLMIKY